MARKDSPNNYVTNVHTAEAGTAAPPWLSTIPRGRVTVFGHRT